jgi:hypothetical protein
MRDNGGEDVRAYLSAITRKLGRKRGIGLYIYEIYPY